MHYRRRDRVGGNDDSGLVPSLREEVVLQIAVAYPELRTVVAGRVTRARNCSVEAVGETCAQIQQPRPEEVCHGS
jgi:hypothetical protein